MIGQIITVFVNASKHILAFRTLKPEERPEMNTRWGNPISTCVGLSSQHQVTSIEYLRIPELEIMTHQPEGNKLPKRRT